LAFKTVASLPALLQVPVQPLFPPFFPCVFFFPPHNNSSTRPTEVFPVVMARKMPDFFFFEVDVIGTFFSLFSPSPVFPTLGSIAASRSWVHCTMAVSFHPPLGEGKNSTHTRIPTPHGPYAKLFFTGVFVIPLFLVLSFLHTDPSFRSPLTWYHWSFFQFFIPACDCCAFFSHQIFSFDPCTFSFFFLMWSVFRGMSDPGSFFVRLFSSPYLLVSPSPQEKV